MKKQIKTKQEKELASLIGFNGKYVDSLIVAAKKRYEGEAVKELLKDVKNKDREYKKRIAKEWGMNPTQYKRLKEKASEILGSFNTKHSMGCSRYLILNYRTFQTNHEHDQYGGYCKYRPTYGNIYIYLSKRELQKLENIGGIWTIVNPDGSAKWLAESGLKNKHKVQWIKGFVVGTTHSTISIEDAEIGEAVKLQSKIKEQDNNKFIGYRHVKLTGACDAGIEAYCRRNGLNKYFGYTIGYLKSLEDSEYLNKI